MNSYWIDTHRVRKFICGIGTVFSIACVAPTEAPSATAEQAENSESADIDASEASSATAEQAENSESADADASAVEVTPAQDDAPLAERTLNAHKKPNKKDPWGDKAESAQRFFRNYNYPTGRIDEPGFFATIWTAGGQFQNNQNLLPNGNRRGNDYYEYDMEEHAPGANRGQHRIVLQFAFDNPQAPGGGRPRVLYIRNGWFTLNHYGKFYQFMTNNVRIWPDDDRPRQ